MGRSVGSVSKRESMINSNQKHIFNYFFLYDSNLGNYFE